MFIGQSKDPGSPPAFSPEFLKNKSSVQKDKNDYFI